MGESYTVQISSNLVRHLLDDGEKTKKRTRKPKPKATREPQHSETANHQKELLDDSKTLPTGWPIQPPLYLPPSQKTANAELDAIWSVIDASEKVLEKVTKQDDEMVKEVTQRARDLSDKEFKLPGPVVTPCLDEKDACLKCYKENTKDPLKCAQFVKGFAECARRFRQKADAERK